ncbi:MAG: hypothetical protein Ct9H300mP19_03300 [Dehalococcoidia bacterium]|nr:MAG: hypothetical protein Ct9H300mP19_03300 [Dehalococcoidia bacterium]
MILDAAYTAAGVPREEFQTICAIAVGVPGTLDDIDPDIAKGNILPMIGIQSMKLRFLAVIWSS